VRPRPGRPGSRSPGTLGSSCARLVQPRAPCRDRLPRPEARGPGGPAQWFNQAGRSRPSESPCRTPRPWRRSWPASGPGSSHRTARCRRNGRRRAGCRSAAAPSGKRWARAGGRRALDIRTGSGTCVATEGGSGATFLRARAAVLGGNSPLDVIVARAANEPVCAEQAAVAHHPPISPLWKPLRGTGAADPGGRGRGGVRPRLPPGRRRRVPQQRAAGTGADAHRPGARADGERTEVPLRQPRAHRRGVPATPPAGADGHRTVQRAACPPADGDAHQRRRDGAGRKAGTPPT
jgi:hypothetical protein